MIILTTVGLFYKSDQRHHSYNQLIWCSLRFLQDEKYVDWCYFAGFILLLYVLSKYLNLIQSNTHFFLKIPICRYLGRNFLWEFYVSTISEQEGRSTKYMACKLYPSYSHGKILVVWSNYTTVERRYLELNVTKKKVRDIREF